MMCHLCSSGESHCFGKYKDPVCECTCRDHSFDPDDIRFKFVALLSAEAHDDFALLKLLINELSDEDLKASLLLAVKYAISTARQYGEDPVRVVQTAALYWAGGSPNEDEG